MKQGTIALLGTGAGFPEQEPLVDAKVAPPRPAAGTLANMVQNAMLGATIDCIIVVDYGRRKVAVFNATAELKAEILASSAVTAAVLDRRFTSLDLTKTSPVWSVNDGDGASVLRALAGAAPAGLDLELESRFGFGQSSRSLSGLVGDVEDALDALLSEGFLVIDQNAQTVRLYTHDDTSTASDIASGTVGAEAIANLIAAYSHTPTVGTGSGTFGL